MKKIFFVLFFFLFGTLATAQTAKVKTGDDLLFTKYFNLIKGKKIGLVTNHTGLLSDGRHIADALHENKDVKLIALFGPEHGVRGDTTGAVENAVDKKTGVPAYSLYGKTYKPSPEMLKGVEVLIYDIQDVGARFYTYISTLGHIMEAAAENNIPVIVLDRPNPITGVHVDGFLTDDSLHSFVAFGRIPVQHGMTVGELAELYNGEHMLSGGRKANLTVVKMEGWKRNMWYDETGLKWVKTSPNLPVLETAEVYPGTCFFEGVNISEGRGTDRPFQYIGAPWADGNKVSQLLKNKKIKGADFKAVEFTPKLLPNNARPPKFNAKVCRGVYLSVKDRKSFMPVEAGVYLLWAFKTTGADSLKWRTKAIDQLAGTARLRTMLDGGKSPEDIIKSWQKELADFKKIRSKYLLYK
ncbi:MAG: DUF1343 domain-containing protein [Ignavibacteria bacterium]|jgi:uncharacterized protein YbbC (DUF1343 family)|nr:DUF1343 domain-containing protein [Ignavibacteria bacterium]MCU7499177.1 DUF1343 domain-containing protein [Ignavibacteria bacterium]MCU7512931.1 DUF1343 domain-containing protein [Ignavibacteria bacterium]MCU7521468.1 DUF1343 domain-containing protein [Ignavibacteria bacterium]MCU7526211.1 DUF1343 domain-containing protein [Ignavibacteria bacterium]